MWVDETWDDSISHPSRLLRWRTRHYGTEVSQFCYEAQCEYLTQGIHGHVIVFLCYYTLRQFVIATKVTITVGSCQRTTAVPYPRKGENDWMMGWTGRRGLWGIKRKARVLREKSIEQGIKQMGSEDSGTKSENEGTLGIQWVGIYFAKSLVGLVIKSGWLQIREVEKAVLEGSGWPSACAVKRI